MSLGHTDASLPFLCQTEVVDQRVIPSRVLVLSERETSLSIRSPEDFGGSGDTCRRKK